MAIPQLKESLCGCSLRTGTKIIGWVSVSLSLALLLILIFLASLDMKVLADIIGTEIGSTEEELKRDKVITVIGVFIFLAALLLIVSIFFDVMLLVGVYNDRKGFIFAWIIFQLVFLVIDLINTISTIGHNWAGTFTDLLVACFSVYLLLIVFSHYNNLKARRSSLTSPPAYEI